jgi:hypothetical protein
MHLTHDVQTTFLNMLFSVTAGRLPHSVPELHHAETTTTASQLETHIQAAPVEQFAENRDTIYPSVSR